MIESMTGYGRAVLETESSVLIVEMRSVNHRFLDVKLRAHRNRPLEWDGLVKTAIAKRIQRGSVEVLIEQRAVSTLDADAPSTYTLNLAAVAHHFESLKSAQKILGLDHQISLRDVFHFPDAVERTGAQAQDSELTWDAIEKLVIEASEALATDRKREGAHLFSQLMPLLEQLNRAVEEIGETAGREHGEVKQRISARLETALGTTRDEYLDQRIAQEIVLLLDRSDISEELHRLKGHLAHFAEIFSRGSAVGRRLEFCLQEVLRELNTIGSKSVGPQLSRLALETKAKADQMREQVLNLE